MPLIYRVENSLKEIIEKAVNKAMDDGDLEKKDMPEFAIETPGNRVHGDLSANIAMVSARIFGMAPRQISENIIKNIALEDTYFKKVETAGPGFLNFFFSPAFYSDAIREINSEKELFGRSDYGKGKKVMVEFVSANPTGPMHMGNARGGAIGDCLASVMDVAGYDVYREFYVNDAGNQIEKFAISLEIRYKQIFLGEDEVEFPEDAYHGDDIKEHAKSFAEIHGDKYMKVSEKECRQALVDYALPLNIVKIKSDLETYRIHFDNWFMESSLHESGEVDYIINLLEAKGKTYKKEDAIWYKSTDDGEEKDEVLVRANGHPTYFAADIAYHHNKFKRGFDLCINAWGADHHGHVARMKGALDAVGLDGDDLEIVLYQMVRLMRDGEIVRMSKRSGKAIQLLDLLEEVPVDAARFLFNSYEPNTSMDFDLDLAVEQSSSNPVYYVQYAHARICSIIRNLEEKGVKPIDCGDKQLSLLTEKAETDLIYHLASFPADVVNSVEQLNPSRIVRYTIETATLFHKFYNDCRVDVDDNDLKLVRLALCISCRHALRNALEIIKVNAPERM